MQLLWLRLPLRLARVWPGAGIALSDGHYLTRWPPLALLAAVPCLAIGVALGAMHQGRTFTYSLLLLLVLGVIGQLGAAFGLWATIGYAFGDLVLHEAVAYDTTIVRHVLPSLLSYAVLGLLTVMIPLTAIGTRGVVRSLRALSEAVKRIAEPVAAGVVGVLGGYIWAQTTPLLIRPVFTWAQDSPDTAAIAPLQNGRWVIATTLGAAAVGRVFLDRYAVRGKTATFSHILWAGLGAEIGRGPRRGAAGWLLTLLGAVGATLLMAGVIDSWVQGVLVLAFFAGLLALRHYLILSNPRFVALLARIPLPARLAAGLVLAYLIGKVVISHYWYSTQTFLPVLASACAAIAVITLLTLPPPGREQETLPLPRRTGRS
ncbi:hypothetical protein [Actinoplanes sp. NPDC049599]|uniref:hypothetical protein n=1 Tax=Actinoplanes sp. NPDC049599 TaxID=3363903 RepID=UPI00379A7D4D